MPRIMLQFADQGWHVRWRTPNTEEFEATRDAFKTILSIRDRYWDPDAFEGRGGWWVAYGALASVGHLFENYQEERDQLERPYWQRYEEQIREARGRFAQEQKRSSRRTRQQHQERVEEERRQAEQQRKRPRREEVKLPKTLEEALALLHLSPPITSSVVRQAYRTQALKCHPDRGGSHAAMVAINAAYEMALAACC